MRETIWSIEDFLSQYTSQNTIQKYYGIYKDYFKFIYPKLQSYLRCAEILIGVRDNWKCALFLFGFNI